MNSFSSLEKAIIRCERCPRLRTHCAKLALNKKKQFRDWNYWGKPVPGFGSERARFWIVGLAPGAHGANRTGRLFTGDSSGDWLYSALYRFGFSSQSDSSSREDGLQLKNTYISCVCRCAPPDNKPTPNEIKNCQDYLKNEWQLLRHPPLVLALGKIAFDQVVSLLTAESRASKSASWKFKHGAQYQVGDTTVLASYHPSRQNTQTKRLTPKMWDAVFKSASQLLENHSLGKN